MENKKGFTTMQVVLFMFFGFIVAILGGLMLWGFNLTNDVLDQDIDIGQVNLRDVNDQTFGSINTAFVRTADYLGLALIFGMLITMFGVAYFTGSEYPKLFIGIDVIILIFAFIIAVYISSTYDTFINSYSGFSGIYIDNIPKTSKFILNLPLVVSIIGVIIMVLSYTAIGRKSGDDINVYGY